MQIYNVLNLCIYHITFLHSTATYLTRMSTTQKRIVLTAEARSRVRQLFREMDSRQPSRRPLSQHSLCMKVLSLIQKDKTHGSLFMNSPANTIKGIVLRSSSCGKKRGTPSAIPAIVEHYVPLVGHYHTIVTCFYPFPKRKRIRHCQTRIFLETCNLTLAVSAV